MFSKNFPRVGRKNQPPGKIKQVWRKKETPPPPWTELPRDITANILQRLSAVDILESAQKVCTTWRNVCKDPSMWRTIDMANLEDPYDDTCNLEILCQHAVDRSQGQLIDIRIDNFGNNYLIKYIAERSCELRRLRLSNCFGICHRVLCKAAKSFPFLEELHFFFTSISTESIEEFGHCCPLLKSFTLNDKGRRGCRGNDEAFAVAKSMHGLKHLQLFGNKMTNEGLQAILDGCPNLESLDLRQCFNLDLNGELGRRCSQQIKDLRRPHDSTADYEFASFVEDDYDSFDDFYTSEFSDLELYSDYGDYFRYYDDFTRWDSDEFDNDYFEDLFGFY